MKELTEHLGQLFIIGFPGEQPSRAFLDFIGEKQIGGVILFEENCRTHQLARQNILEIRAQYPDRRYPFIGIDQEGGRVCRLRGAPAEFPPAAAFGDAVDLERFEEDYSRSTVFLEAMGFNLNLAPVADLALNPDNECLRGRCFGSTPDEVIPFVRKSIEVAQRSGLLCCLKHFPGLGAATVDPHLEVAEADYDRITWQQREMLPFQAGVEAGADLVMTTHLRAPATGRELATASAEVVGELLRTTVGFDGPVITDDLTMKGAAELGSIGERAVAAFRAGHDIILIGRDFDAARQAFAYFCGAVERGEVEEDRLRHALGRVSGIKFKLDSSVLS